MIDADKIAHIVTEETKMHAERTTIDKDYGLSVTEKLSRLEKLAPLPAFNDLVKTLESAFWSSTLFEEGRPCTPRLLYLPQFENGRAVHWLDNPVSLTPESLRKLTPLQGIQGYLIWGIDKGVPKITGIMSWQGWDPISFIITAETPGALNVSWYGFQLLSVRAGEFRRLSQSAYPSSTGACIRLNKLFGSTEMIFLTRAIQTIIEHGHGGAIWILCEGAPIESIKVGHILKKECGSITQRFSQVEQRRHWIDSIAHLAGIDGAVLIDSSFRVLGFSAFTDSDPTEVQKLLQSGTFERVLSSSLGGGRHRSAVQFCKKYAPAAAVVVSEDGRITFIGKASTDDVPWSAEVAPLGETSPV